MTALLNRSSTFLAEPRWLSIPFEIHPKTALDKLFDSLAVLASFVPRADHVLAQEPTLARRLMAQELLNDCLDLEMEMGRWYTSLQNPPMSGNASEGGAGNQPLFWLSDPMVSRVNPPFNPLFFRDNHTALALSYYWAALVLFYPTIWRLYFAAVIDAVVVMDTTTATMTTTPSSFLPHHQAHEQQYHQHQFLHHHQQQQEQQHQQQLLQSTPSMYTPLPIPQRLQDLDPMRYSLPHVRQIAGDVCRALDFLLLFPLPFLAPEDNSNTNPTVPVPPGWAQPDLLWLPLHAVARFFRELGSIVSAQPADASQAGVSIGMGMGMGMQMGAGMGLGMEMGLDMGLADASSGGPGGSGVSEGRLVEEMWCDGLRERLLARAGEMREVVAGRRWFDAGSL